MGLATRVIPSLLIRGEQLVKGKQFNSWRSVGHPMQALQIMQARGCDELILLDIGATPEGRGPNLKLIEKLTAKCFVPITVGGGVRSVQDVRDLLNAGADKAAIKTNTEIINPAAEKFGRQAIVAAVDVPDAGHRLKAQVQALTLATMGAGEILLTAIDREGTMDGYDLETIAAVSTAVNVPVIAHGGCSGYRDMVMAVQRGASAVAAGALFQFTECTPKAAAQYLQSQGIEARV